MNYYPHHIGDFIRDTANLNDHQIATYMRMIWAYYLSEKPFSDPPEDIAFAMRSDEKTIQLLLRHYFIKEPDGWHQKRIDREVSAFKSKGEKRRGAANVRWSNANALQNESISKEKDANQEPRTNNQEPRTTKPIINPPAVALAIAFRQNGIKTQPFDPRLLALVSQGISVDLINSACDVAKQAKPGENIGIAYVLAIIERWAKSAKDLQASGAQAPTKVEAWWASDAGILKKGASLHLVPRPGEKMHDFKARIHAAIEKSANGPEPPRPSVVVNITQPKKIKPQNIPSLTDFLI